MRYNKVRKQKEPVKVEISEECIPKFEGNIVHCNIKTGKAVSRLWEYWDVEAVDRLAK